MVIRASKSLSLLIAAGDCTGNQLGASFQEQLPYNWRVNEVELLGSVCCVFDRRGFNGGDT